MTDGQIEQGRADVAESPEVRAFPGWCSAASILWTTSLERRRRRWRRGSLIDAAGLGEFVGALVKKVAGLIPSDRKARPGWWSR